MTCLRPRMFTIAACVLVSCAPVLAQESEFEAWVNQPPSEDSVLQSSHPEFVRAIVSLRSYRKAKREKLESKRKNEKAAAIALETREEHELELAVQAEQRRQLDALKRKADRLRAQLPDGGKDGGDATNEDAFERDYSSRLWNWFRNKKTKPATTRKREEVDESLRNNGVTIEVDGTRITKYFENLDHLEGMIAEETKKLDKLEEKHRNLVRVQTEAAERYERNAAEMEWELEELQPGLNAALTQAELERAELRAPLLDGIVETLESSPSSSPRNSLLYLEYANLFEAIADEVRSTPSSHVPAPTESKPESEASQLLGDLDRDQMTREEYNQVVEQREQATGMDEATRREAAVINRDLVQAEQAYADAQRRYNDLVRQQAQRDRIRQAYAEQERRRRQWQYQQQLMQQFSNLEGLLGGSSSGQYWATPSTSRPSPSRTRVPNRPWDGRSGGRKPTSAPVKSNQRQNRNAQDYR